MSKQQHKYAADVPIGELPVVELSDRWRQIVHHVAKGRELTYEDYDGKQLYNGKSLYEIHRIGATGELAVQIGAGLHPEIYIARLGDGGRDFRTRNGDTVDVKSTFTDANRPKLPVEKEPENWADIYVLAHLLDWSTVRVVGYCSHQVVKNRKPKPFPYEDGEECYVVPQTDLRVLE